MTDAGREVVLVRVSGDVDAESAPQLAAALGPAARTASSRTVVDLSGAAFADSAILHVLLEAEQAHRALGAEMVVAGPFHKIIERLFEVTGTTGFFVLADDVEAALVMPRAVTER
ncbi:STAS domain-containing protein [Streptomyces sp. 7R007]